MIITLKQKDFYRVRKNWAKIVNHIDTTQTNGYAFEGQFVNYGRPITVEPGAYIMEYYETGSANKWFNREVIVILSQVIESGLQEIFKEKMHITDWALNVRDKIAASVNG